MNLRASFGSALRAIRKSKGLSQESLDVVSSRTYISSLERGTKSPTLDKIDQIATAMDVHPMTLIALTYLQHARKKERERILRTLQIEIERYVP